MAQFVTRIDDRLAHSVDELVEAGVFESRSEAVRAGLDLVVDRERRRLVGQQINAGYERIPESEEEMADAHARGRAMILEEPWWPRPPTRPAATTIGRGKATSGGRRPKTNADPCSSSRAFPSSIV